MVFTGYTVRMIDTHQVGDGGESIRMFCLEGGGPHQNPTVSKYADFAFFEFSPRGFVSAALWLAQRGQMEFAQLLIDIGPEQKSDGLLPLPVIPPSLPTAVRYGEVRTQVPNGHILLGVSGTGVETVRSAAASFIWILGMSGTGRTNSLVLRVEERRVLGHKFLGYDPHALKDGSLTNIVYEDAVTHAPARYRDLFLMPMARNTAEGKAVLKKFLDEFDGRKSGRVPKPWQPWTILIDEVDCLVGGESEDEREVEHMLRRVVRVCSQEGRAFCLEGICTSQRASGLAWLRKLALVTIVHQLLLQSEKELVCHEDKAVMADMDCWPAGRTLVYGVGLRSALVVQQPYFDWSESVANL